MASSDYGVDEKGRTKRIHHGADAQEGDTQAAPTPAPDLGAASKAAKAKPAGDDFRELSAAEYAKLSPLSKAAYDKRLKLRKSIDEDKKAKSGKGFSE